MRVSLSLVASPAWTLVLSAAALACQEPGADWVPTESSTTTNNVTVTSTSSSGGSTSGAGDTSTEGGSSVTTVASSDSGGSSNTADGSGGDSSSDTVTEASNTSDASADSTDSSDSTSNETSATAETSATSSSSSDGGGTGGVDPASLIVNGDFGEGEANWEHSGDGEVDASSGEYCVTFGSAGTAYADWPIDVDPASIASGVSYVFSYQVYYTGSSASVSTKIGQPYDPYAAFAEGDVAIGTSPQTFMHEFTTSSDDQAGIRFSINGEAGAEVCFDNVQLVAQ